MSVGLVFVLGLLLWTGSTGSVVTQLKFAATGNDVTLEIMDPAALEDFLMFNLKYNNTKVLVAVISKEDAIVHSERVVYNPQNYSLTLKNLTKADSGLYEALLIKTTGPIISKFMVTVKDPVSPVKLTVDSVSKGSESCNFTVSCRTEDVHMRHSFTCNNQICDNKQEHTETTPSAAALHLYLSNMSIICNHSNEVSWTQNMTDVQQICTRNDSSKYSSMWIVAGGVAGGVVVIVCFAAALFYRQRQKKKRENQESPVYEVPEVPPVSALSPGDTADLYLQLCETSHRNTTSSSNRESVRDGEQAFKVLKER